MKLEKFQQQKNDELLALYPQYSITFMVNDVAIATQVEKAGFHDLDGRHLKFGDFEHKSGFMINKNTSRIFVMSESILEQHALFDDIKKHVDFKTEKLDFIIKKSIFDIDYLVRENNHVATHLFNDKEYFVFEKAPDCYGDSTLVYIVCNELKK